MSYDKENLSVLPCSTASLCTVLLLPYLYFLVLPLFLLVSSVTQFLCRKSVFKSLLSLFYSVLGFSSSLLVIPQLNQSAELSMQGAVWTGVILVLTLFYDWRPKYHDYFRPHGPWEPTSSAPSSPNMAPAHSSNLSITQPLFASPQP